MEYTEEVKKEADRIVEIYNRNVLYIETDFEQSISCAIQDRQSVLDALKSLFPLQDYNDEVILVSKCKSIMAQIEYLKSKI